MVIIQLNTIMSLLSDNEEKAFSMSMLVSPTLNLLKSLGVLYANPLGWQMRALQFIIFFRNFGQKSKSIFKL